MRATHRITWLLLSTCFLFHIASASDAVSKDNSTDTTEQGNSANTTAAATSVAPSAAITPVNIAISQPTTKLPTTTAATSPTGKPAPTQPATSPTSNNQPANSSVASNPPAGPGDTKSGSVAPTNKTDPSVAPTNKATPPVTTSPPRSLPTAVNTQNLGPSTTGAPTSSVSITVGSSSVGGGGGGGSPTVPSSSPSITTPGSSVSGGTGTAPVTTPGGGQGNVGTTAGTKVPTAAPAPGQGPTSTQETSQPGSTRGEKETTVPVTNQQSTTSNAPQPSGSTGTTFPPSTLTKAGATSGAGPGPGSVSTEPLITISSKTPAQSRTFQYSLNTGHEREEEKDLAEVCRRLLVNLQDGNCTLTWRHHNDKVQFECVEINGKVKTNLATQFYEEITKKHTDSKTLIAILASCGALLIMIVILAVCASHHRKPYHENQQHLTEELHTVENGYHDNPTLEVMEVQPEMQEKKTALNGEFNDSWIVPIDNLLKEEIPDEEDTHL